MQRLLSVFAVVLLLALSSSAQNAEPIPAPADVILQLRTEGDQHHFRLGELIPLNFSYVSDIAGRYLWVSPATRLAGGHPLEISCSPSAEPVSPMPPSDDFWRFENMLNAPCGGVGGGGSIGCGPGADQPLSSAGIHFGPFPLNTYVRFRAPGTYTCSASAADVTTAPADEKLRPALLLKSNALVLSISEDPIWSHSAALTYRDAYDKLCRGEYAPSNIPLQCFDLARRLTYLDTSDSLAAEVKFFDGRNHGWDNGFWNAIQSTSYRTDALLLMTSRIEDPDFQVSDSILELLAVWELKTDSPAAFQNASPVAYHMEAIEKLRKYVRLLGSSLSKKNPDVLAESAKTYRLFATQEYCERHPLVPKEEQDQVLVNAGMP